MKKAYSKCEHKIDKKSKSKLHHNIPIVVIIIINNEDNEQVSTFSHLTQFLLTSFSLSQQAQQEPRILLRKAAEKYQQGPL